MSDLTKAERDVLAERAAQRAKWSAAHDDDHDDGALAASAAFLADPSYQDDPAEAEDDDLGWAVQLRAKHAGDRRRQLVISAALAIAEIERLDRVEALVTSPAPDKFICMDCGARGLTDLRAHDVECPKAAARLEPVAEPLRLSGAETPAETTEIDALIARITPATEALAAEAVAALGRRGPPTAATLDAIADAICDCATEAPTAPSEPDEGAASPGPAGEAVRPRCGHHATALELPPEPRPAGVPNIGPLCRDCFPEAWHAGIGRPPLGGAGGYA